MLKTNKKGCSKLWEALKSICNNSATYLLLLLFQLFGLRFCIELWTFKASSKFFWSLRATGSLAVAMNRCDIVTIVS